jgi:hypothetical protein
MKDDSTYAEGGNKPFPVQRRKRITKSIALILVVLLYTAVVVFASIELYQKKVANEARARLQKINPRMTIHDGLVNFLDTKTITREISYRDSIDRSMLVTWKITSDFSNPRDPRSHGTLTINYIADRVARTQELEFVTLKPKPGYNDLYFRMVAGNEFSNAAKDWYKLSSSDIYTYQPRLMHQRDPEVNLFGINGKATGFEKFKGFDFFLYNDPAFYVITGQMRESSEKKKIISEIYNDKAYVLLGCEHNLARSWCHGAFNTAGMASIIPNYAASEGLGSKPGLKFEPSHFWFTANNQSRTIKSLEVGSGDADKIRIVYSNHNQPVSIPIPDVFIK